MNERRWKVEFGFATNLVFPFGFENIQDKP